MAISMLKIRRPLGRLIFNMGIAIPGKTVFLIETAPCKRLVQINDDMSNRETHNSSTASFKKALGSCCHKISWYLEDIVHVR